MSNDLIPGYESTLIWSETKNRLQDWRRKLPDQSLALERRLATAAIEYCLAHPETHAGVLAILKNVIRIDIDKCWPDTTHPETVKP